MIKSKKILFTSLLLITTLSLTGCVQSKKSVQKDVDKLKEVVEEVTAAKQMDSFTFGMNHGLESSGYIDSSNKIDFTPYFVFDKVLKEQESKIDEIKNKSIKEAASNFLTTSQEYKKIIDKGLSDEVDIFSLDYELSKQINSDIDSIVNDKELFDKITKITNKYDINLVDEINSVKTNANKFLLEKYSSYIDKMIDNSIDEILSSLADTFGKDAITNEMKVELKKQVKEQMMPLISEFANANNTDIGLFPVEDNIKEDTSSTTNSTNTSDDVNEKALKQFAKEINLEIGHLADEKDYIASTDIYEDKTGISISAMAENGIVDSVSFSIYSKDKESTVKSELEEKIKLIESYFGINNEISKTLDEMYKELISNKTNDDNEDYLSTSKEITINDKDFLISLMIHDYKESLTDSLSIDINLY